METLIKSNSGKGIANEVKNIKGWGIDADADNNPTYPIKNWNGADHDRLNYERAPQQEENIEVLKSIERPALSRVFGTSTPPKGLSGMLRRYAFKFSEGSSGHWMTLILADRVNVVEGLIDDVKNGYIPNLFKERGWAAEWKYNRKGAIKSLAVGVGVTSALVAFWILSRRRKNTMPV